MSPAASGGRSCRHAASVWMIVSMIGWRTSTISAHRDRRQLRVPGSGVQTGHRDGGLGLVADLHLDLFRGLLAHDELVVLTEVPEDRNGHLVARDPAGPGGEHPAVAEHGGLGRAAADVHDHVRAPLHGVDAAAHGAGDRLVDGDRPVHPGLVRSLEQRTPFQLRRAGRHADGHPPVAALPGVGHRTSHHSPQVSTGRLEVGDHTVLQRPQCRGARGDPSEQLGGLPPDRDDPSPPSTAYHAAAAPTARRTRPPGRRRRPRCWRCPDRFRNPTRLPLRRLPRMLSLRLDRPVVQATDRW